MTISVAVNAGHIARGLRGDSRLCPIALAIQESTGLSCVVGARAVWIDHDKWYRLPDVAADFVLTFDVNGQDSVAPVSFTLTEV